MDGQRNDVLAGRTSEDLFGVGLVRGDSTAGMTRLTTTLQRGIIGERCPNRPHMVWVEPSGERIKEWIGQQLKFGGGDEAFLLESSTLLGKGVGNVRVGPGLGFVFGFVLNVVGCSRLPD